MIEPAPLLVSETARDPRHGFRVEPGHLRRDDHRIDQRRGRVVATPQLESKDEVAGCALVEPWREDSIDTRDGLEP